ncbi:MAG: hypothetical protein ACJZ4H_04165 [Candidatus Pelagibacter sp.]
MRKYISYSIIAILGTVFVLLIYLSIYGIKTEKFNDLIIDKVKKFDPRLSLNISEVYLKLNTKEKSINIHTENTKIYIENEFINLISIDLNLDVFKFLRKENSIKNIKILTKKSKIKKITDFLNEFKFSIPRAIIFNQIKDGYIEATVNIDFDEEKGKEFVIEANGRISDGNLNILNKIKVKKINFEFNIKNNKFIINNAFFNNKRIDFKSKKIFIEKIDKNYEVKGDLDSNQGLIDLIHFSKIFNFKLNFIDDKKILAKTKNKFNFKINSNKKIKDLNINSEIFFEEIFINSEIQDLVFLRNGAINTNYENNNLNIDIESGYSFLKEDYQNNEKDKIKININKEGKENFRVKVFVKNNNNSINSKELSNYIYIDKLVNEQNLTFDSNSKIDFEIDNYDKVKNLKINSNLILKKILINYKYPKLNKIFPNYKNVIKLKNNLIDIDFSKNKKKIDIKGNYSFNNKFDKYDLEIFNNKNYLNFSSIIEINNSPIILKEINYIKKKDIFSKLEFNGKILGDKKIKLKNIKFSENQNKITLSKLYLSDNYKIIDLDKALLKYFNDKGKLNQLKISKNKNNFELSSEKFYGESIIANLLKGDSKNNLLDRFKNFNSEIVLNFNQFFINDKDYLKKINGKLIIENNKVKDGNLSAKINDKNEFSLNIKSNNNNEKITNLFIDKPAPFIKNYNFIKGFNNGKLSYSSIENKNITKSNLKIYDFKVKEVPVLAKILTLASLQGIADLLTGEGIRFDEFEMDYKSSINSTKIQEIYAIGPAISILMDGYIEKDKITSLRGTLVPATTINKNIAKIPILGEILVGKKSGEGVFGVSFKIKGTPNNLKTTVNPVKTLTPRFITRTLEKLK